MPLFTQDIDLFQRYVGATIADFTVKNVLPDLETAEETLLVRFLGEAVAAQIIAFASQTLDPTSPAHKLPIRAVHLARTAVGKIGFAGAMVMSEVQIGDDGITVTATEGRKAAFEYQTNKLERTLLDAGWRGLDQLISLVAANTTLFTAWDDSPYYTEHQTALIATPAQFSRWYPIQDRWLTFWALRPFLRAVESGRSLPLRDAITAASLPTGAATRALDALHQATCLQTVVEAIPHLSVEINGAQVQLNYAGQYQNNKYHQPPGREQLDWLLQTIGRQAQTAWDTAELVIAPVPSAGTDSVASGPITSTPNFIAI